MAVQNLNLTLDATKFIGREIGNVTILKEIGRGGKGIVFAGFQKSLKRQVAVKILAKAVRFSDQEKELFQSEAEIVASLSHPNIIPIFDMGSQDDCYFQIMQFIQGSDLNRIIEKRKNHPLVSKRILPLDYTLDIMNAVLAGLDYAHRQGVVHQDIKPSNILIETSSQRPLIADFGIAKTSELENSSRVKAITGSPLYISPEQAAATATDQRTDIYSLGVVLFKMVAGSLPRRDEGAQEILVRKARAPQTFFTQRPSEVAPTIDVELERIILLAVEPDVGKRYQDCQSLQNALADYRRQKKI